MAGQRQPIELLEFKGKKHLTKKEIADRKASEVKAPADKITPPAYLNFAQRKKFNKLSKELVRIGIMSNLDCDVLARYLIAEELYLQTVDKINNSEEIRENVDKLDKYSKLMDKYFKQCQSCAKELGLTVSSRCRLVVPKAEDVPKENKFARFGGMSG